MPIWIAKNLMQKGKNLSTSKVLIVGITFKEDVAVLVVFCHDCRARGGYSEK